MQVIGECDLLGVSIATLDNVKPLLENRTEFGELVMGFHGYSQSQIQDLTPKPIVIDDDLLLVSAE